VDVLGFEVEVFMQAMPTMFSAVDSERLAKLKAAMNWKKHLRLEQFAKHVALLHDNRLGKHDRALFVLNWLVVRARVSGAMFKGYHAIGPADGIDNVDAFASALEKDIAADIQCAKDKANSVAERPKDDSYKEDSLVRKAIDGLKLLARDVLGHPMARSKYRKELKAYHRMLNPGIQLTFGFALRRVDSIDDSFLAWIRFETTDSLDSFGFALRRVDSIRFVGFALRRVDSLDSLGFALRRTDSVGFVWIRFETSRFVEFAWIRFETTGFD
jgi:hypothetical protein